MWQVATIKVSFVESYVLEKYLYRTIHGTRGHTIVWYFDHLMWYPTRQPNFKFFVIQKTNLLPNPIKRHSFTHTHSLFPNHAYYSPIPPPVNMPPPSCHHHQPPATTRYHGSIGATNPLQYNGNTLSRPKMETQLSKPM